MKNAEVTISDCEVVEKTFPRAFCFPLFEKKTDAKRCAAISTTSSYTEKKFRNY